MNKWIIENEIGCMPDLLCVSIGSATFQKAVDKMVYPE